MLRSKFEALVLLFSSVFDMENWHGWMLTGWVVLRYWFYASDS